MCLQASLKIKILKVTEERSWIWIHTLTVLRIRIRIWIHRIHMFLGLLDPDPSITKQK